MQGIRLDKLLSNLGYASRKEVAFWAKAGRLSTTAGEPILKAAAKVYPQEVLLDGEALDPYELIILLHKPVGVTCSRRDRPPLIFDLLPPRFDKRSPSLSCVGRLDKDTSGAILLTDNGQLLHRLTAPGWKMPKVYKIETSLPITLPQLERLAAGGWCLPGEDKPLAPALAQANGSHSLDLILTEGRYHQVKRMLEAVGNPLTSLHRASFAGFAVGDLAPGQWRYLDNQEARVLKESCRLTETQEGQEG